MAGFDDLFKGIRHFEAGGRPYAPKWDYKLNTWGYGTPYTPGSSPKYGSAGYDQAAETAMQSHAQNAYSIVNKNFPGIPENVKLALTDLTYNAGTSWINAGLGQALGKGDMKTARQRFGQYVNAGGEPLAGLKSRRKWGQTLWDGTPKLTGAGAGTTAKAPGALVNPLDADTSPKKSDPMGMLASVINPPANKQAPVGVAGDSVAGSSILSDIVGTPGGGGATTAPIGGPLTLLGLPVGGATPVNLTDIEKELGQMQPAISGKARAATMNPTAPTVQQTVGALNRRRSLGI